MSQTGEAAVRTKGRPRPPSVVDVARLAGVSIGTVSRVLNNTDHPVGEATRARVLEAAAKIDYSPNALGRSLTRGRTHTVGVIVHDITDSYFNEIVRGIDDVAGARGYLVLVCSSYRDAGREFEYVRKLRSQRCDGIIFVGGGLRVPEYLVDLDAQLEGLSKQGGAVVMLAPTDLSRPRIVADTGPAIGDLVDHLVGMGHRDIALVEGPPQVKTSAERAGAFDAALQRHGVHPDPELRAAGHFDRERGAAALAELFERRKPFTAAVCLNDQMAVGCLMEAKARGLRVPEDLSIAGIDDLPVARYLDPPLTTVRVPMRALGRAGMRSILSQLEGNRSTGARTVPCEVVVRRSTGPAPTTDSTEGW
ncbi:MAG TPA: LacI family DNA-binding transcriptional regulator [Actinomycetota bacterium]|nr:LacI family DNA-binding transcriptional regulator [Actinomycetota bacterium]